MSSRSTPGQASAVRYRYKDFLKGLGLVATPKELAKKEPQTTRAKQPIAEGSRNSVLVRMAGAARRFGAGEPEIAAILQTANSALCEPPLESSEVEQIAGSVVRYAPGDPGAVLSNLTDVGNATRLAFHYGDRIRYVPDWKKWIIWDKTHWQLDGTGKIVELAKVTARRIHEEAAGLGSPDAQGQVTKHALASQKAERLRAMVELAKSIQELVVRSDELDKEPMLLGVRNGVVDLRTGELRPATPEDLMTMQCPVDFDPSATCPVFVTFLERVTNGDPELTAYLARITGYSLTGSNVEQCLFFLHGSGANGKTTFLNVVKDVLGPDYCKQTPAESLMAKKQGRNATNDLARLKGVRVTLSNEVEEGSRLSESLIKQMTGSDVISARYLYAEFFDYVAQFKIWIAGNHQPVIRGSDDGIWRRLHLVPFTVTIPLEERDKTLPGKLQAELPGILNWAVKGCLEWQEMGLQPPRSILEAVAEYKSEMDILGQWVEEKCVVDPGVKVQSSVAYDDYKRWAMSNGYQLLSHNAFSRRLKERYRKEKNRDGTFYHGLRMKTP
jgi:putative DNA primase/helicase